MNTQNITECNEMAAHDDTDKTSYEIENLGNGFFRTSLHVARSIYGGIIGPKATTKKGIEIKSKTVITIPRRWATGDSTISIDGKSKEDVQAARTMIESLVESLRMKTRPTHFTCVPACTDEMKKTFNRIKEDIISEGYPGIDELLFIDAGKIHITFAPCTLLDDKDQEKAVKIFKECSQEFVDNKLPIEVTVRGLKKFDDEKSSSVAVLFGGIQSPMLQAFANKVLKRFKETKLNSEDRGDTAKLHMTIMNVQYRIKVDRNQPRKFDARDILTKYADTEFGTFLVHEMHLSQMRSTDENGFYKALCVVSL